MEVIATDQDNLIMTGPPLALTFSTLFYQGALT